MKKSRTIWLVVVFVLGVFGICCEGAGAGWSQNFARQGIHLSASAGGYEETAYANYWGHFQQGIEGRYYQYEYSNMSFNTLESDPSKFYFDASWDFSIVKEENYTPNFNINADQNSRIDAFGTSLWMYLDVSNDIKWVENPEDPMEWYPVITDDIALSFSFNLEPGRMENIGLRIDERKWGEDPVRNTLWISFTGSGYIVPEPATIALLGLGGLPLIRRKRK